jgi:hypothetical protein
VTRILGEGLAANCCAHLLNTAGIRVTIEKTNRPKVPALLIGSATQALIEDVFERPNVFRGAQRISKRIVAWGSHGSAVTKNTEPVEVPHSAVVISEQDLVDRLKPAESETRDDTVAWTIVTSPTGDAMGSKVAHHFGSRVAQASSVQLKSNCARDASWIESLESGWLFLLPGLASAWLLSVGGPAEELLAHSRMVGAQIESLGAQAGQFPAYPRISDPLCGGGWLACGSAAMAFDPICGDGTGNAIREAILASAVIRAIAKHAKYEQKNALFEHFRTRLLAGFLKHLQLCRQFYAACSGEWWTAELRRLDEGIAWCREQLGGEPAFRYRLRGFELEPVSESLSKKR